MAPVGIGERLRSAREARGLSLDEIEAATRIRRRFLEALEAEAFDQLPGGAYARGFLRTYASYLGLPAEDLVGMSPDFHAGPIIASGSPVEVRITPAKPQSRARRIITGIAVLVAIGIVLLAYMLYSQLRQFALTPPPVPPGGTSSTSPPVAPAGPAAGGPRPSPEAVAESPPPATPPASPKVPAASPSPPQATTPAAPTASPSSSAVDQLRPLAGPLRIAVAVADRSWVRTIADGVTVFEGFLNGGDRQLWQARHEMILRIGNASAVDLTVNGRPLGRLGNPGDVVVKTFTVGTSTP